MLVILVDYIWIIYYISTASIWRKIFEFLVPAVDFISLSFAESCLSRARLFSSSLLVQKTRLRDKNSRISQSSEKLLYKF